MVLVLPLERHPADAERRQLGHRADRRVTSAHYGGNWSGWCEQFAEQAEGFKFTFGSALDDYRAEYAANRIHSDSNPPVGALVFYDGD